MEYLERPLIEGVEYDISETCVAIQSQSTCFVSYSVPARLQKETMLLQYKRVLQMAREQGVKISYSRHIRRTICEQWADYLAECEKQEHLFQELREVANSVKRRGIHMGHADDEELAKVYKITGELAKFRYGGRPISRITGIGHDLQTMEKQLSEGRGRCDMIAL